MAAAELAGRPQWRPWPKQESFLKLGCYEAMFGGAAGPGKSETLVVNALRHVGDPRYRALLLRRTVPELTRSEGLIDRAEKIYRSLGARPTNSGKRWLFDSGARIELASMQHEDDRFNFSSAEYQFVGFDELTSFTEKQYRFMVSRLRSSSGIPVRLRSATNPGGVGHEWVLNRWAPWLYPEWATEYDGPRAGPGEVLHYLQVKNEERIVPKGTEGALGRCFVPGLVKDNPTYAGGEYEAGLELLDPLSRAQLKHGDWLARPGLRVFFKREWFPVVEATDVPRGAFLVRWWDRAATADPKADWTVGLLLAYAKPTWWIVDVVRGQWEPADVKRQIEKITREDTLRGVRVALSRDPASAGKFEAMQYMSDLAGHDIHSVPEQRGAGESAKIVRARPVSAQAEQKNIRVVRAAWNRPLFDELEGFPDGHDDQVDALAGAFRQTLTVQHGGGIRHGGARDQSGNPFRSGGY